MKKFILSIPIFFLSLSLIGQEKISLAQAIEMGIQNNYQVEIARQNLQLASNNNDWGAAGRYPRVDLNLNSSNGYRNAKSPGFLLEQSALSGGITPSIDASWTIYDGKRIKITKQQLEQVENQTNLGISVATENTIQAIILAYNRALIQEEQLTTLREVLTLSRDRIEYQNVRKEFGQAGKFDLLQTQDAYLNDSTNILIQENNVATAYRDLNLAMGQDDLSKVYELIDGLNYEPKTYQLEVLEQSLFANNQNLQSLMINRELANINTQFQESFKKPTISLGSGLVYDLTGTNGTQLIGFGGQEPFETDNKGTNKTFNFYFNIQANYNLFDGGNKNRNIENAKVEELVAQLNINELKRTLSNQLQNALANYNNQLRLVKLTENLIDNAQQNLTIGEERFKGGLITSFDYRNIQLSFVNASQARLNAIFNLKNTEVELMRLTGDLIK
ncbi:MAG: TolC family protein [Saprospiraceae bacterium]